MLSDLHYRIRAVFRRNRVEQELDEELRFHLDRQVEKNQQAGAAREEAARRARLDFGGLDQVKDDTRDARGVFALDIAWRDLRYGLRVLSKARRSPRSPYCRWPSASAPIPPSSNWSTPSACARYR